MNVNKVITEQMLIECSVCLEEIPESAARVSEAQDYIQHYCGIDCYKEWQDKQTVSQGRSGNRV